MIHMHVNDLYVRNFNYYFFILSNWKTSTDFIQLQFFPFFTHTHTHKQQELCIFQRFVRGFSWIFVTRLLFLQWGVVSPTPNPQAGGLPLVGCPWLFIRYIRSYSPYLKAVSSIRNLRTCHAMVTRDPLNMFQRFVTVYNFSILN
jgi:hypothetical protein